MKGECNISELCNEHGITQGMYYKWRDQLLTAGTKLFDRGGVNLIRERLERENCELNSKTLLKKYIKVLAAYQSSK